MDLRLQPGHEAFRAEIRHFLATHGRRSAPTVPGDRPNPALVAWQALLLQHGYAGRFVPREYGGFGAAPDVLEQHLIVEEFTSAGVALGIGNQGISMLVPTLLELGTEEQKRAYIAPTLRGELVWCQGYSEPGAGSDLASLQSPGVSIRPLKTMTGRAEFNEVFFTDVRVPMTQIVGRPGDGWKVANATLAHERAYLANPGLLAADVLGAGWAMIDRSVAYARERRQFGRQIGSFQAVKHMCAEMAAELEITRALVWYAAYAIDQLPAEASLAAAHAKALLAETGRFVARTATEVHGGMGITDELGLHFWFKRIDLDRQLYGGPERARRHAADLQGLRGERGERIVG